MLFSEPSYAHLHPGLCKSLWMSPNTKADTVEECGITCNNRGANFFAYSYEHFRECVCYGGDSCPQMQMPGFVGYDSYKFWSKNFFF